MRGTFGSPLRLATAALTAGTIAAIETTRFKKLIPETLQKIKEIIGEGTTEENTTGIIRNFQKISGFLVTASGYLRVATALAGEEPVGTEFNDYESEHASNLFAFFSLEPNITITGWSTKLLKVGTAEPGHILIIYNNNPAGSGRTVTLKAENPGSKAENRFSLFGPEVILAPHQAAFFIRQGATWKLVDSGSIATTPTPSGVEGTIVAGGIGQMRKRVFALTGNGVTKAFPLKHEMETQAVNVTVQTSSASKPSEVTLIEKIVATSESEVEVTFKVAPAKGLVFFVTVFG